MREMIEFRCGGRKKLLPENHAFGWKEFTRIFVVMYVYLSSRGIFKIVTAEVQESI
jgi:hypothetical protein